MAERAQKLQRLNQLRRSVPYVSQSALAAILLDVKEKGVPELHQRKAMQEATSSELAKLDAYGPLLQTENGILKSGDTVPVLLVNPLSYMHAAVHQGGSYTELLLDTHRRCPSSPESPWELIVYSDEVVPGNVLASRNERKTWAIYGSFMQHGQVFLQKESAWMVLLCKRTTSVDALDGGISQLVAMVLKMICCNKFCTPQLSGMNLVLPGGEHLRIWFRLGMFLQDGAAHKYVLGIKGDSGSKFCMLCKNDFKIKQDDDDSEEDVPFTALKHKDMLLASDEEVLSSVDRLAARKGTCSKAIFAMRERACGFNHQPNGLLLCKDLRDAGILQPVSQFCHDYMHGTCSNGTLTVAIFALCTSLSAAGLKVWSLLAEWVDLYKLPECFSKNYLAELFSPKKVKSYLTAKKFKCQASEALCLYPMIAHFVHRVPLKRGLCIPQCKAFLAMADVVDLLQSIAVGVVEPQQLLQAVEAALACFIAADWGQYMIKKFHWLLHLPDHLRRFKMLPACWCLERKHKLVNRYANPQYNTISFERSILLEVLSHDLAVLKQPGLFDVSVGLVTPHNASSKLRTFVSEMLDIELQPSECLTSTCTRMVPAGTCSRRDFVLLKNLDDGPQHWDACEVWAHLDVKGDKISLVCMMKLLNYSPEMASATWQSNQATMFVQTADILCCLTYTKDKNDQVNTLIPYQFRFQV